MFIYNHKKTVKNYSKMAGFTLVEMLVAVFVFSVVMVLSIGAIFSVVSANKTSQAIKSVMDNLSSALDSMSSEIRYGTVYNCGGTSFTSPSSCPDNNSNTIFSFVGRPTDEYPTGSKIKYYFYDDGIKKSTEADGTGQPAQLEKDIMVTAPEVIITSLHFYVLGATASEAQHPQLLITISGYVQVGTKRSDFNIETMVSQRKLTCKQWVQEYLVPNPLNPSRVNCPS